MPLPYPCSHELTTRRSHYGRLAIHGQESILVAQEQSSEISTAEPHIAAVTWVLRRVATAPCRSPNDHMSLPKILKLYKRFT